MGSGHVFADIFPTRSITRTKHIFAPNIQIDAQIREDGRLTSIINGAFIRSQTFKEYIRTPFQQIINIKGTDVLMPGYTFHIFIIIRFFRTDGITDKLKTSGINHFQRGSQRILHILFVKIYSCHTSHHTIIIHPGSPVQPEAVIRNVVIRFIIIFRQFRIICKRRTYGVYRLQQFSGSLQIFQNIIQHFAHCRLGNRGISHFPKIRDCQFVLSHLIGRRIPPQQVKMQECPQCQGFTFHQSLQILAHHITVFLDIPQQVIAIGDCIVTGIPQGINQRFYCIQLIIISHNPFQFIGNFCISLG